MKILFVHNAYMQSSGGEDATVEAEIELLSSKGHETRLLLFRNQLIAKNPVKTAISGIKVIYNRNSAHLISNEIKQFKPDIIHIHNFFFTASPAVILQASKEGVPIIVTLHNFRLICPNAILLRQNKICELCVNSIFPWSGVKYKCYHDSAVQSAMVGTFSAVHKILGTWRNKVTQYITPAFFAKNKLLMSSLKLRENQISVKRNFIQDPGIRTASDREEYYLFVGRLSKEKGVVFLLEAFKNAGDRKIMVVGDGPEETFLMSEFASLGNVKFAGKKSHIEVLDLMKRSRALIFPSICYEGLPLTIIEAFATGTPVIASRLGAMEEIIKDGQNGLHFHAGDPGKLNETLDRFEEKLFSGDFSMYENARKDYLENFHPDICYEQVMKIYKNAITVN